MVSQRRNLNSVTILGLAIVAFMCATTNVDGQEFKIETAIYAGDAKLPVAQNVTLFQNDLIVDLKTDFANPPNVLATKVYDSRQKTVALLDHNRNMRLEISDNRLLQMVDGLRRDISQKDDLQFLVNESFKESASIDAEKIVLTSPTIRYQVEGKRPEDGNWLQRHNEFLDIFTRLSASDPGGFPPFARLRLNESIKKMGWIPSSVEIVMEANALVPRGLRMKSTHTLIDGLSKEDTARIAAAKKQWMSYPVVSLLKFHGIEKTASLDAVVEESATTTSAATTATVREASAATVGGATKIK